MAERRELTPKRAKQLVKVARVLTPALAPLAPHAARGLGMVRHRWEVHRAHRLGVPPDQVGSFTGKGAALHARLSGLAGSLAELDTGPTGDADVRAFAERVRPRLTDLTAAVRAAERMTPQRRRAAHRAVAGELDALETELLRRLGVAPGHGADR